MASSGSLSLSSSGSGVYTGPWINWSYGMFVGATLTLSNNLGLILVSFLAIFVGMTGGHLWGILTFVIHQARSSNKVKDGLFHQEQVALRNSSSAAATLWELLKMGWAWRGRAHYSMWRMVPLVLLATVQILVFAVAGIFSSEIFSTSQEVLVRSPSCGFLEYSLDFGNYNQSDYDKLDAFSIDERTTATWALTYSRSCYGDNTNGCDYFAVPQIESTFKTTSCPFADELCLDPKNGALVADTGFINTNYHLGINSKPEESIDYRRVTTCAPLNTDGFIYFNDSRYEQFYYGTEIQFDVPVLNDRETWFYDTWAANGTFTPYTPINYRVAYAGNQGNSTFIPIPQLNKTDADVTLIFIVNNVEYMGLRTPTDMWYNATLKVPDHFGFGGHTYRSPYSVMVMGCTEQHQFCQPNGTDCFPLSGWYETGADQQFLDAQLAIAHSFYISLSKTLLGGMIATLGADALLASLRLLGSYEASAPLPAGFWKEEIKSWQNYSLSYLQKSIVGIAKGPANPTARRFVVPPTATDQAAFNICNNMMIRDGRYYSFKILGLLITIVAGSLIILANLSISTIIGWAQRKLQSGHDRREDWELDHVLQLQRLAFEGAKLGTWARNGEASVPVTIKALGMQKFGKPGRGVGTYEPVGSNDLYADHVGLFSEPPSSTFSPGGGFTEYVGAGGRPMDDTYQMGPYKKGPSAHVREFV